MLNIEGIRERCEAATPGPWYSEYCPYPDEQSYRIGNCEYVLGKHIWRENADFIAHAREDIPFLLAEVERLSNMVIGMQNCESEISKAYNRVLAQIGELLAKIASLTAERDAAVRDVPQKCWSCRYSFCNTGKECNLAHYTSESSFCLSWQWRGIEGKEES